MDTESKERISRIRDLNDAFRRTFVGGKVLITCGVDALPDAMQAGALLFVRVFDKFSESNDPHGEHDFGSFDLGNRKFFWKIDYYDERWEFGSADPSDPERTKRVLTLMLADEY